MNRKKPIHLIILLVLCLCSIASCTTVTENQKQEYGILESAVTYSADKVIGTYGDNIPMNFSAQDFMKLVEGKIPDNYYAALKKYNLEIRSRKTYYLLTAFEPGTNTLILFDYSCTPEVDGPVLLEPGKYDLTKLELYDKCKGK